MDNDRSSGLTLLKYDASLRARTQAKSGDDAGTVAIEIQDHRLPSQPKFELIIGNRNDDEWLFLFDAHYEIAINDGETIGGVELMREECTDILR